MSGPLLAQPSKMDQMLEEHDRKLQEFTRQGKTIKKLNHASQKDKTRKSVRVLLFQKETDELLSGSFLDFEKVCTRDLF